MKRRTVILLALFIVLTAIGTFLWLWLIPQLQGRSDPNTPGEETSLDPFGNVNILGDLFSGEDDSFNIPQETPKLQQIAFEPVAGAHIYTDINPENETGEVTPTAQFVARSDGNVYQNFAEGNITRRISNTTIPRLAESFFLLDNRGVLFRYITDVQEVDTLYGEITASSTLENTVFFPTNITAAAPSPLGYELFFVVENEDGATGYISDFSEFEQEQIFSSPLKDWRVEWSSDETLLVFPKNAAGIPNTLFTLDINEGKLRPVLTALGASGTMSSNGRYVLYSYTDGNTLETAIFDREEGRDIAFELGTLSEKCSWDPYLPLLYCAIPVATTEGRLPDAWYQGRVITEDVLVVYDVVAGGFISLYNLPAEGVSLDIDKIYVGESTEAILLRDKQTGTLWRLIL